MISMIFMISMISMISIDFYYQLIKHPNQNSISRQFFSQYMKSWFANYGKRFTALKSCENVCHWFSDLSQSASFHLFKADIDSENHV